MASSDSSPGDEREVLTGLPNARPHRRSAKRDRPSAAANRKRAAAPRASKPGATSAYEARITERTVPAAGYATPGQAGQDGPKGADLFTTAVQAVGELAQIGVAASGRAVKSALQRLPRP